MDILDCQKVALVAIVSSRRVFEKLNEYEGKMASIATSVAIEKLSLVAHTGFSKHGFTVTL